MKESTAVDLGMYINPFIRNIIQNIIENNRKKSLLLESARESDANGETSRESDVNGEKRPKLCTDVAKRNVLNLLKVYFSILKLEFVGKIYKICITYQILK